MSIALPNPPASWPQLAAGISLCMIVRDEERFLGDALASVRDVVDEICVVDTGSKDRTIEIAREAGATVAEIVWPNDFSAARNAALEMATKRWILVLDADEMLLPRSQELLRALRDRPAHLTGLWIRCFNLTSDEPDAGKLTNAIVRVFPNHPRLRYRNAIHEFIALDGDAGGIRAVPSPIEIVHRGYIPSVMEDRGKAQRNLALVRAALARDADDPFNWYNFAMTALIAQRHDESIAALERMRDIVGERPQAFVPSGLAALADLYLDHRDDPQRAADQATQVLKVAPHLANAHFTLGKALLRLGKIAEGRAALAAAIEDGAFAGEQFVVDNEVSMWKAHSEIGASLMREEQWDLAIAWFDMALQARPEVVPLGLNRARALEGAGRSDEAEGAYRSIAQKYPTGHTAVEHLNFLLRAGKEPEALAAVDQAALGADDETRLILLATGAALAARTGGIPDDYLRRALASTGVTDRPERIAAVLRHYGDSATLRRLRELQAVR